ncbi:hypothetical protein V2J09_011709 [Rumex salicifolius]
MKAALKGKYEYDSDKEFAAFSTVTFPAGDLKLRASLTDATFSSGPSFNGLALAIEKPGSFIVDYNVHKKDFRFQFMNSFRVLEKPLNMTYIHTRNDNRTMVDGTLVLDPANKVSANHTIGSKSGKVKYTYLHRGVTSIEQCYDFGKNAWDFALARKIYDNVVRASYQTSNSLLGLEWARNSKTHGCFKISATVNLEEEVRRPKLFAETTWNFEMF